MKSRPREGAPWGGVSVALWDAQRWAEVIFAVRSPWVSSFLKISFFYLLICPYLLRAQFFSIYQDLCPPLAILWMILMVIWRKTFKGPRMELKCGDCLVGERQESFYGVLNHTLLPQKLVLCKAGFGETLFCRCFLRYLKLATRCKWWGWNRVWHGYFFFPFFWFYSGYFKVLL